MITNTDILIIGAGITGCAVTRELSRFSASVTVVDRGCDVAEGATKANSGIVHAGYDAVPGTQKALYNVRGASMYPALCRELGVPFSLCGALVIAFSEEERTQLEKLLERGVTNGVKGLKILERDELLRMEPHLNPDVLCALHVPTSGIVSPYEMAFALADDAALNGVQFRFNCEVQSVSRLADGGFRVKTSGGDFVCRALVNCAGSSGALVHNMLSDQKLEMVHRRGQYYLLDRAQPLPFSRTIFQCPSVMGKGVLISPTVHGNLLLGPTAEDIDDPLDTATTASGLANILEKATRTWPKLSTRTNITNFSGVRAHLPSDDFIVGPCPSCENYFEAIGIESPGLSSAPAIGSSLAEMIAASMKLNKKQDIVPCPSRPKPFHEMDAGEKQKAAASDPAYGNIICRCEVVTEAEIRAAIRRPVGARTIDGVKRRTRAGMGRCQGGFCLPRVAEIIAEETGLPLTEITKNGGESLLLCGTIDSFLKEAGRDE